MLTSAVVLSSCSILFTRPDEVGSQERFNALGAELPVSRTVDVYWNEYSVPFIHAQNDADAAFVVGYLQAHLRLGQMELLRRLSQGRTSEVAGPFTKDIDHALRAIDFGRASHLIEKSFPDSTRLWVENFVKGINFYQEEIKELPVEHRLMDIDTQPWTPRDIITIGRLASIDISWLKYIRFLFREAEGSSPSLEARWKEELDESFRDTPSFSQQKLALFDALFSVSRSGSNCLVVGADKSLSSAGLIAADPHLGIFAPNLWLLMGVKSPSYHMLGYWIPGAPIVGVGRNKEIAWGGTNMRAISTHLYKISDDDLKGARQRKEKIGVRWFPDVERSIRESRFGPIITDASIFEDVREKLGHHLAFHWQGHEATDEFTSFLKANRAKNWTEFRAAFEGYGVSAQNMLYADRRGNIGMLLAYREPRLRDHSKVLDFAKDPTNEIVGVRKSTELPFSYNPAASFIASANNKPVETKDPIAFSYSRNDRVERLKTLASEKKRMGVEDLKALQNDTYHELSHRLSKRYAGWGFLPERLRNSFAQWNGRFDRDSRQAAQFELFSRELWRIYVEQTQLEEEQKSRLRSSSDWLNLVEKSFDEVTKLAEANKTSLIDVSAIGEEKYPTWGDLHRLSVRSPLGGLPLVGSRFRFADVGSDGHNDTLNKAGRRPSSEAARVTFGANSRFVADMSSMNENYFVMLGGNDGWLKGPSLDDQVELWRKGEYMKIPLELDEVEASFSRVSRFAPSAR